MFAPSFISSFSQPFLKNFDSVLRQSPHQHKEQDDKKINQHASRTNNPSTTSLANAANTRVAVQGVRSQISQATAIQIETKQGDKITLRLNQTTNSQQNAFQIAQESKSRSVFDASDSFSSNIDIQIEGDLNEDEKHALSKLMNKMSKVSDAFFGGDVETAFKHAQKVGFDSSQIAGFSMDLKMQKSVQAVVAYQQTRLDDQKIDVDRLKQANQFLDQSKTFMTDSQALLDSFTNPKQSFSDLFEAVGQLHKGISEQEKDNRITMAFQNMMKNITDDLFDQ